MMNIIQRKISEMIDHITFSHDVVPPFDHDGIHLIYALKGALEVFYGVFIIEVCIGSKEGLHTLIGRLDYLVVPWGSAAWNNVTCIPSGSCSRTL